MLSGPKIHGWAAPGIGYIHILKFYGDKDDTWYKGIDNAIDYFLKAEALILDARGNFGGEDLEAFEVVGRFADKKRRAMTSRYRTGRFLMSRKWGPLRRAQCPTR